MEPRPSHIQAILFDADNTLFTLSDSIGTLYKRVCKQFGFSVDASEIDDAVYPIWKQHHNRYLNVEEEYRTTPAREKQFWIDFVEELLMTVAPRANQPTIIDAIYHWFALADSRTLNPHVMDLLELVKSSNLVSGVFSNNDARLFPLLEDMQIEHLFDHVFTSGTVGYKKPSAQAFMIIADILQISPEQLLYIGDNPELDFAGARGAGWHAVLYDPCDKTAVWPTVRCFSEIFSWLSTDE
jgi:putative hydrolase of the HAD superfamily